MTNLDLLRAAAAQFDGVVDGEYREGATDQVASLVDAIAGFTWADVDAMEAVYRRVIS